MMCFWLVLSDIREVQVGGNQKTLFCLSRLPDFGVRSPGKVFLVNGMHFMASHTQDCRHITWDALIQFDQHSREPYAVKAVGSGIVISSAAMDAAYTITADTASLVSPG